MAQRSGPQLSQGDLTALGYRFQFVTLSGFHSVNHAMFRLAHDFRSRGMGAYADLQQEEFGVEPQPVPKRPAAMIARRQ